MKKMTFFLISAFAITVSCHASDLAVKKPTTDAIVKTTVKKVIADAKQKPVSRQCCEQSATDSHGNVVTIEACAGWFLSNDEAAYDRACDKARAALAVIVGPENV